MSWKNLDFLPWRGTLRLQTAKYLACCTTFLMAACMTLAYLSQRQFLFSEARKTLDTFATEFHYEYLCQKEEPPGGQPCPLEKLPAICRQTLRECDPPLLPQVAYWVPSTGKYHLALLQNGFPVNAVFNTATGTLQDLTPCDPMEALPYLDREFNEESYGMGANQLFLLLMDADGDIGARSDFDAVYQEGFQKLFRDSVSLKRINRMDWNGQRILFTVRKLYDGNYLLIGKNVQEHLENLRQLLLFFVLLFLGSLPLLALVAAFFARRISAGLDRVGAAAEQIARGDYSLRLETRGEPKEMQALIRSFNYMTDNTQKFMQEIQNVTDDIAHDLRTPLTRMRTRAELELMKTRGGDFPALVAEECDELIATFQTMLDITRLEKRLDHSPATPTDLNALLKRMAEAFATLAEDRKITMELQLPDHPVIFECQPKQWERMAANLLDNALKYTPAGGQVSLRLEECPGMIRFSVEDNGVGIAPADQGKVFQRFYRADASRSQPGNGLGLSMVKAVAESLGGTIQLFSQLGKGTTFLVLFPHSTSGNAATNDEEIPRKRGSKLFRGPQKESN